MTSTFSKLVLAVVAPLAFFFANLCVAAPAKRPQEPVKPYPYVEEEVSYESRKPSRARFAGTLTRPGGSGPFAAVLLITGSGPQNRNEELMGHKPFLVLADDLTRRGLAVLRVDDRGVGGSTGDTTLTTMRDYVQDALAGVAYLKSRPDIDRRWIGLIGHSEGGMIAPAAAAQSDDVAFIVMIAGPGVRGADILTKQNELIATVSRLPESVVEFNVGLVGQLNELILHETDNLQAADRIEELLQAKSADIEAMDVSPDEKLLMSNTIKATRAQLKGLLSPWMRYFLGYDPLPALKRVHCPVLAVNGSLDMQVPADQNLPPIEAALEQGATSDYQVLRLAGLNHVLQTAVTGSPAEYGSIEETISPSALQVIGEWVAAKAGIAAASAKSH